MKDRKPREIKITWKQFKEWKEEDIQRAISEGFDLACDKVDDFHVYGVQQGIKLTFTFGIFRKREQIKKARNNESSLSKTALGVSDCERPEND